jgi:uncharacterized protein (DUF302 family)
MSMLHHDIRVGLNVPVRVYIYRDETSNTTRFEYDQPSTLMGGLDNRDVTAVAEQARCQACGACRTGGRKCF